VNVDIRPWREDDAPALDAAIRESLDHLRPWMPWISLEPQTIAARVELIRRWAADALGGGDKVLGIWADGTVAGGCGLHRRIGPEGIELGYWVRASYTRRGVAAEAVRQLCLLAFEDPAIRRVEIHHDRANELSGRVAARAGFTHVEDRQDIPEAPGEEGVERVWRLQRAGGPDARTAN
jgi:RimJ/RimL family protein N-acetyltransferase